MLTVVFMAAEPVFVATIVDKQRLVDANGKLMASGSVALIGGPGVGGALVQLLGAPAALLADAVSFVVSAAMLARIRVVETVSASAGSTLRADVAAGLRYVLHSPFQRTMVVTGTISNFVATALTARATIAILMGLMLVVPVFLHYSPCRWLSAGCQPASGC
jgi:hypothetical protein